MSRIDQYTLGNDQVFLHRTMAALQSYCYNTVYLEVANDVQTVSISGSPTGGSFTLANGPLAQAEAPPWNATAAVLQAAIQAGLPAGASCVCTGGPLPATPIAVTFTGGLAQAPQNAMTVSANNLTGGTNPAASVAHTTVGVAKVDHATRAALASKITSGGLDQFYGQQMAKLIATDSTIQTDYATNKLQSDVTDAHIDSAIDKYFNTLI